MAEDLRRISALLRDSQPNCANCSLPTEYRLMVLEPKVNNGEMTMDEATEAYGAYVGACAIAKSVDDGISDVFGGSECGLVLAHLRRRAEEDPSIAEDTSRLGTASISALYILYALQKTDNPIP